MIGNSRGGRNTKLHATCDAEGRLCDIFLTRGEASDYKSADVLLRRLPKGVKWFLADKKYDEDWVRNLLESMGITPAVPGRKNRTKAICYNKKRYKQRNKIERAFTKLKDWRRVDHRYDLCPEIFLSACAFAVVVIWWV